MWGSPKGPMGKSKTLETALDNKLLSSHEHLKKCIFSPPPPVDWNWDWDWNWEEVEMGVGVLEVGVEAKAAGGEDLLSTIVENHLASS